MKKAKNEVIILKNLDHPFIIKYIDDFEYENRLVIVASFADGKVLLIFIP